MTNISFSREISLSQTRDDWFMVLGLMITLKVYGGEISQFQNMFCGKKCYADATVKNG